MSTFGKIVCSVVFLLFAHPSNAEVRRFACRIQTYPNKPFDVEFVIGLTPPGTAQVLTMGLTMNAVVKQDGDMYYFLESAPYGYNVFFIDILDDRKKAYFASMVTADLRVFKNPSLDRNPVAYLDHGQCDVE